MLETIIALLVILWILGLVLKVAGAFIHLLLVLAVVVLLFRIIRGGTKT